MQELFEQGVRPGPGLQKIEMSRGQRVAVLGEERGIDDAYTRPPMSSLEAALRIQRMHNENPGDPCSKKRRMDGEADVGSREYLRAPRVCIEARNGTEDMQRIHRSGCNDERCIAAFRDHKLLHRDEPAHGKRKASAGEARAPPGKKGAVHSIS